MASNADVLPLFLFKEVNNWWVFGVPIRTAQHNHCIERTCGSGAPALQSSLSWTARVLLLLPSILWLMALPLYWLPLRLPSGGIYVLSMRHCLQYFLYSDTEKTTTLVGQRYGLIVQRANRKRFYGHGIGRGRSICCCCDFGHVLHRDRLARTGGKRRVAAQNFEEAHTPCGAVSSVPQQVT